jgi:hypothetical protein
MKMRVAVNNEFGVARSRIHPDCTEFICICNVFSFSDYIYNNSKEVGKSELDLLDEKYRSMYHIQVGVAQSIGAMQPITSTCVRCST